MMNTMYIFVTSGGSDVYGDDHDDGDVDGDGDGDGDREVHLARKPFCILVFLPAPQWDIVYLSMNTAMMMMVMVTVMVMVMMMATVWS